MPRNFVIKRILVSIVLGLLIGVAVSEVPFLFLRETARPPREIVLTIPAGTSDQIARGEQASELVALIRRLPPDQQRVLVLKFSHGLKNREIGDLMGRSEGAIKQLVHRALVSLRATVEREAPGA